MHTQKVSAQIKLQYLRLYTSYKRFNAQKFMSMFSLFFFQMLGSITNQKKKEKEKETLDISATYFQIAQSIIKIYKLMTQNTSEKTK